MKTKTATSLTKLAPILLLSTLIHQPSTALAQGSAFTYQGRLQSGTNSANGSYDFTFTLFGTNATGTALAGPVTNNAVGVTNGLFTTVLDLSNNFPGTDRWLELGVRSNLTGAFTTLSPRQKLTPTPYAIFASTASNLTGVLPSSLLSGAYPNVVGFNNSENTFHGAFTGDGSALTLLNAGALSFGQVPTTALNNAWQVGGNTGTSPANGNFLGTTDNQPLELKVNGMRVLRLEPTTNDLSHTGIVNVIGGSAANIVGAGVYGATISGGGASNYFDSPSTNRVDSDFASIGGGGRNTIQISAGGSAIAGGYYNTIQPYSYYSTIGGGDNNTIQPFSHVSTIGGGEYNTIQTNAYFSTIGGGDNNTIQTNAYFSTIGGGGGNTIQNGAIFSTIGGGEYNTIQTNAYFSIIGGGNQNTIRTNAYYSTIGGGIVNTILTDADYSTVAGGSVNAVSGPYGMVPGGISNTAGAYSFAAGTEAKANHTGSFVWADSTFDDFATTAPKQFLIRASGGVGINTNNPNGAALNVNGAVTVTGNGIFNGGNLGIGTNSPGTKLHVIGGDADQLRLQHTGEANFWWVYSSYSGDQDLHIQPAVGMGGYVSHIDGDFHIFSDQRLKRDINPLGGVLERVLQLRPVSYHFRSESGPTHPTLGLIAQEVEPLFPEVVGESGGMKSLAYSELVPVTIGAIQEINQKLTEELKRRDAENAELKQKNNSLEQRLEALEKIFAKETQP